jgi:hypothetical protein
MKLNITKLDRSWDLKRGAAQLSSSERTMQPFSARGRFDPM